MALPWARCSRRRPWMNSMAPRPRRGSAGRRYDARVAGELAGEDCLLLIAPREGAGAGVGVGRPHVVGAQGLGGAAAHGFREDPSPPGVRRLVVGLQGVVLVEGEVLHEPLGPPVLGHVGETEMLAGFRAELRHVLAVEDDPALLGRPHPGEGFGELGLAVAVDAGDAQDSPPAPRGSPLTAFDPVPVRTTRFSAERRAPPLRRPFSTRSRTSRPTSSGPARPRPSRGVDRLHPPAVLIIVMRSATPMSSPSFG